MKTIFITQKIVKDKYGALNFVVENNWYDFFKAKKINLVPVNKVENMINFKYSDVSGIIIHGGNDLPSKKRNFENSLRKKLDLSLIKFALKKRIPILGVCYGFQVIAEMYGYKLKKKSGHVKTSHKININLNYIGENTLKVNSFHNYVIKNLPKFFNKISKSSDGTIELAYSNKKKILCTMFHPERKNKSQKLLKKIIFDHFNI